MARSTVCDSQFDAFTDAEKEFYPKRHRCTDFSGQLTRREVRELVRAVCSYYRLPGAKIRYLSREKSPYAAYIEYQYTAPDDISGARITFTGANKVTAHTLLHELAHLTTNHYFGPEVEDHGPEFVGVLSRLYDYYRIIPSDAFGLILRRHGVKRRAPCYCGVDDLAKIRAKRLDSDR